MGDGNDPVTGKGLSSMAHAQSGSARSAEHDRPLGVTPEAAAQTDALDAAFESLRTSALRCKAERDRFRDALVYIQTMLGAVPCDQEGPITRYGVLHGEDVYELLGVIDRAFGEKQ